MASEHDNPGECDEARALLCELFDATTHPARVQEIKQQLSACPHCLSHLRDELEVRGLVRRCCGEAHAPEPLRQRIITSITTISVTRFSVER
ncbi:mycothiol system anti-sigma-R factor [Corynebacterium mayonis]|uniref:mycothiol system anti-sigma-R factor n=1 Tax=Corynebacterium mayonis TaxID=3062461 RepID=UPI00313FF674